MFTSVSMDTTLLLCDRVDEDERWSVRRANNCIIQTTMGLFTPENESFRCSFKSGRVQYLSLSPLLCKRSPLVWFVTTARSCTCIFPSLVCFPDQASQHDNLRLRNSFSSFPSAPLVSVRSRRLPSASRTCQQVFGDGGVFDYGCAGRPCPLRCAACNDIFLWKKNITSMLIGW